VKDNWMRSLPLYVETSLSARNHGIVSEDEYIPLGEVCDHSTFSKLMELAVLNDGRSLLVVNT
jgi:hypothetical protein